MGEVAHVWEDEENSQTTNVIAYLMQYLFDKVLLFFPVKKKIVRENNSVGGF